MTTTNLRVAGGSGIFSATDNDGKSIRVSMNIGTHGAIVTASGEKAYNQLETRTAPARPFWFVTKTVENAMRKSAVYVLADKIERL
jgi:hypothetical protein